MSIKNRKEFSEAEIKDAIANSNFMNDAAHKLGVDWRTFRYNAEKYGLYSPKIRKGDGVRKYELVDILNGLYPQYSSSKLLKRLVKEGYKEYKCESCGICDWKSSHISLELNHKDGVHSNHSLNNLEILCPNCHSQTKTYRNKRGRSK